MKKVALYVRVSTEEQRKYGLSVDNQIEALTEYASKNNYKIFKIYNDAGISARKSFKFRPALQELICDCQSKQIDLILFTRLDRWFRSVADYYEVQKVLDKYKVPWKAIWEDYETETSAGIFKVNIMLSIAQSEADKTSERVRNTFEYKKSKGEYCGGNKPPVGYSRDGKKIDINPDEEKGVRALFDTYLATHSVKQGMDEAEKYGVHLNRRIADRILKHPAYYGGLNYVITPYITVEQHEQIMKMRLEHTKLYRTGHKYIFSGLCKCGICGNSMGAWRNIHQNKNGTVHHCIRYVCNKHENNYPCSGSSISETYLESYLLGILEEELNKYTVEVQTNSKKKTETDKQIASIKAKQKRLRDLYEIGDIDFAEYKSKRNELQNKLDAIEKEPTQQIRKLPSNWLDIYNELDIDHKRAFWAGICDHIEITGMCCKNPTIFF